MPRHSSSGSEESPAPRRSSARIAACQINKPASPSPAKKPAIKRKSKKVTEEDVLSSIEERKIDVNGTEDERVVLNFGDTDKSEPLEKKPKHETPNESPEKNIEHTCDTIADKIHIEESEIITPKDTPLVKDVIVENVCPTPVVINEEPVHRLSTENEAPTDYIHEKIAEIESPSPVEVVEEKHSPVDADAEIQPLISEEKEEDLQDTPQSEVISNIQICGDEDQEFDTSNNKSDIESVHAVVMEEKVDEINPLDLEAAQ